MDRARTLESLLAVEAAGDGVFTTSLEGFGGVSFGGQTLGCAALAAAHTCAGRPLHNLHACFLRRVPAGTPIEFAVERLRDGRRVAHRRVHVRHGGRVLCEVLASFAAPAAGPEFQESRPDPAAPPAERLPSDAEVARAQGWNEWRPGPIEWRWAGTPWCAAAPGESSRTLGWARPREPLGDAPGLRAAALAYLSDMLSHWPSARRLGGPFEPWHYTSLDHVLWIHRDLAWDDWWLLVSETDVAHAGRALTRRTLHARNGRLVASVAQEQLVPLSPRPAASPQP
jgi:acyl-CoA thioesterase-2